jgi:Flp pilus assembly protein TadD
MQTTGRMSEALRLAQRGVELNPRLARGHRRLAEVLAALGRREEAGRSYAEAMRLDPVDPELLLDAAALAMSLGHTEEARSLCARVQELAPLVHDARIAEIGGNR